MKSLDIIIVNWNSQDYLSDCISSVSHIPKNINFSVIIVDNNSTDKSLANIENTNINLPLTILKNNRNLGFGVACNQGANASNSEYLLFLNPDTKLCHNSVQASIEFLENPDNSDIGICGVQLLNNSGSISRSCSRFPSPKCTLATMFGLQYLFPKTFPKQLMVEWDHCNSRIVDQIMGAFFLIRRSLFEELGGFDERFFVYFEEVDLSWRAKLKGWNSYYLSNAQVYHKGGGTTENVRGISLFYYLRSRILYGYKHFGFFKATILLTCTLIIEPCSRIIQSLKIKSKKEFLGVVQAYGYLYLWCLGFKK
jgi:N-acetylglucosaminyl-diphospho-decaprenol L-rhamnosyltransferase